VVGEGLAGVQLTAVSGAPVEAIQADRGVRGTRVKLDGLDLLFLADFRILSGDRPLDQATFDMFDRASASLESLGASYSDVVRTWIYLRDILSWYDEFNEGRTRFYRSLVPPDAAHPWPPASTGIEVTPQGGAWGAMDLLAVTGPGRAQVAIEALQSPAQRSPEIYGSCFSRASVLDFGGASTMHVSGTASIDLAGNSLYIDDLKAQTEFTLENVEALLQSKGIEKATFLPSTLFVKPGCDPAEARAVVESWDPMAAHGIWVRADVCRDDLLFEVDGVGALAC
jgi:enamine deaminase RidA (YjgF/YER057c/UK114 family)